MKVRNLREGSSGSVHLAVDLRYGNQVAIKFIPRGSSRYVAHDRNLHTCAFLTVSICILLAHSLGYYLKRVHQSVKALYQGFAELTSASLLYQAWCMQHLIWIVCFIQAVDIGVQDITYDMSVSHLRQPIILCLPPIQNISRHLQLLCSVQIVLREVLNQRLCFHHPQVVQSPGLTLALAL